MYDLPIFSPNLYTVFSVSWQCPMLYKISFYFDISNSSNLTCVAFLLLPGVRIHFQMLFSKGFIVLAPTFVTMFNSLSNLSRKVTWYFHEWYFAKTVESDNYLLKILIPIIQEYGISLHFFESSSIYLSVFSSFQHMDLSLHCLCLFFDTILNYI